MKKLSEIEKEESLVRENLNNNKHQEAIAVISNEINTYLKSKGLEKTILVLQDARLQDRDDSLRCNLLIKGNNSNRNIIIEVCASSEVEKNSSKFELIKANLGTINSYIYDYEKKEWWKKEWGLKQDLKKTDIKNVLNAI